MRRGAALAALAVLLLPGCGDPDLWARWQAERALYQARRAHARVLIQPGLASEAQWDAARRGFLRIEQRWPAAVWLERGRRGGAAADVAAIAGRSAVELGRLAEARGRLDQALEDWRRAEREWGSLPAVKVEIAIARARALERAGRADAALEAWLALSRSPIVDASGAPTEPAVLDAPLIAARHLAEWGRGRAADSLLDAASERYRAAAERLGRSPAAIEVLYRLSDARASRGDADGALAVLRQVLAAPSGKATEPRAVLGLAQRSLEFGRPDTALAYAAWGAARFGGTARQEAMRLAARAWEARGPADSALAAWQRVLDEFPDAAEAAAEARFRRGEVLERAGRWEAARSEWRALAAAQPGHPLAFESLVRIAEHHLQRGETDLGRFEARRGIETLDHMIATQHDPDVSFGVRTTRARLVQMLGDPRASVEALAAVWREAPGRPAAAAAGLAAARLADSALGDVTRARALYAEVAKAAGSEEARHAAAAALERLGAGTSRRAR